MEIELKPCPFCGSTFVSLCRRWSETNGCYFTGVRCDDCYSQGHTYSYHNTDNAPERAARKAALAWNRREEAQT